MEFFRRAQGRPSRLGILPGTFNPITVAHVALGRGALAHVDEVIFALPRSLPHKEYTGASFGERIEMLRGALTNEPAFSIAAMDGGLFVEIAEECRQAYGEEVQLSFLCGRDAAERVAGWDYGQAGAFAAMLCKFDLLVASRGGDYVVATEFQASIRSLQLERNLNHISASEVRRRIAAGEPWEHLVPEPVVEIARRVYG